MATPWARALRTAPCPHCARPADRELPFCPHCGLRLAMAVSGALGAHGARLRSVFPPCLECGTRPTRADARFCGACGEALPPPMRPRVETAPRGKPALAGRARLALLDSGGDVTRVIPLDRSPTIIGRLGGVVQVEHGPGSADEIELSAGDDRVHVRPLGDAAAMFLVLSEAHTLADGDELLIGSQLLRFRLLPAARSEAEAGHSPGCGSHVPEGDVAVLEQMRDDGSVRDRMHLSRGRSLLLGREHGDWAFPYDTTMSARHAEIRPTANTGFTIHDLGTRNGVALAMRGAYDLRSGQRLLMGSQVMRVETV